MRSRAGFFTFVSLLACLTSATVICFSMAILDDALVYAGIACLISVVLVIGTYTGCRYCCRSALCKTWMTGRRDSTSEAEEVDEDYYLSQVGFRSLERKIEDLLAEVGELQENALCSSEALDQEYGNIRGEYEQLTQWIEGTKIPETREVRDLVQRLDRIGDTLRRIRRRSDRITSALGVRPSTQPGVHHHPLTQPPSYEESRRQRQVPNTVSFSVSVLPSYVSEPSVSIAPPLDDFEAPPPYDEAIGTPV